MHEQGGFDMLPRFKLPYYISLNNRVSVSFTSELSLREVTNSILHFHDADPHLMAALDSRRSCCYAPSGLYLAECCTKLSFSVGDVN